MVIYQILDFVLQAWFSLVDSEEAVEGVVAVLVRVLLCDVAVSQAFDQYINEFGIFGNNVSDKEPIFNHAIVVHYQI